MRTIKLITIIAAVFVAIFSTVVYFSTLGKKDKPILVCSVDETITATVSTTDEELLKYVAASDKQDGDLTSKIRVTRKNSLIGGTKNTVIVMFSVCDSDNNVSSLQRMLVLSDYKPPEITLTGDFIFSSGYNYNIGDYVTVTDMIDEDLKDYTKIISPEFTDTDGEYPVNIKASNSLGDTGELNISAIITSKDYFSTKIRLKEYTTRVPVGSTVDYRSFLSAIVYNGATERFSMEDITVDTSKVDLSKPGVYDVFYKIFNSNDDLVTMTRLFVIVTED